MIQKMLVANRGEIARRIMRTAKELGIWTIAAHSEADARAWHVLSADESVSLGPAPAVDSYLKIEQIIGAAKRLGADAVHPGYGFLAERPEFARLCREAGLNFIGPCTAAIATMSSKLTARQAAQTVGIPVLPASAAIADYEAARAAAAHIGYPVMVKLTGGGGGLGIHTAADETELASAYAAAKKHATSLFDDESIFLEKKLPGVRHIEVQIAADMHGNVVHLGERECSLQQRHRKLMEETPSPAIDADLREQITEAAVRLARSIDYYGLGTVELLLDGRDFYFLEMNTRLQVEHTVTEMVTGLDLVEWQIHVAMGEELPALQSEIGFEGHALQCRIYAEDPARNFEPSPGRITRFDVPSAPWVRNDVGVSVGDHVTPYYDPLLAKLIVHGPDRSSCLQRAALALVDYRVQGVATNMTLLRSIIVHPAFVAGDLTTRFLEQHFDLRGS